MAPNVENLTLNICGQINNQTISLFARRLVHLRRLELYGPFLITVPTWIEFFDSFIGNIKPPLEGFLIRQSPRFNDECVARLVENFPNLSELRLAELNRINDKSLRPLHAFNNLTSLDLTRMGDGKGLTDAGIVPLLEAIGANLQILILDENELLTDRTLIEGIKIFCHSLHHLSMTLLGEVLASAVQNLFTDWKNPPLTTLNVTRVVDIDDDALIAILDHSGPELTELYINSCDHITEKGLNQLAKIATSLEKLDVSFVRATDDFIVKDFLDHIPNLTELSVFGNNRVTGERCFSIRRE